MFGRPITLFKLVGFEVRIDLSWIIIAALIVWSLAVGTFPYYIHNLTAWTYWVMGIVGAIGLFASIVFHELCHSLVARRFGIPMKGITLFVFGGVAEMTEEPPSAKAEFFMAIAGPLSSIVIGFVFLGVAFAGKAAGWPAPVLIVLSYLWVINILLAIFNLIPAFPLDGGRVLRSILWYYNKNLNRATRISATIGSAFGIALIVLGVVSFFIGNFIAGIWWVLIGLFLRNAARMSYQSLLVRQYFEGEKIEKFMNSNVVTVPPETRLSQLVDSYIYRYHFDMFPVSTDHRALKCITTQEVKNVPREEWDTHTVDEVAKPCSPENAVYVDDDAVKALTMMNQTGNSRFMVLNHDGTLAGVVTLKDLMRFLSLKLDLDKK